MDFLQFLIAFETSAKDKRQEQEIIKMRLKCPLLVSIEYKYIDEIQFTYNLAMDEPKKADRSI